MNIFDFESFFDDKVLKSGSKIYNDNQYVCSQTTQYTYKYLFSDKSEVSVTVNKIGEVRFCDCSCYYNWYCRHKAAALYALRNILEKKYHGSSPIVSFLTECYTNEIQEKVISESNKRPLMIDAQLKNSEHSLALSLKIGYDKMYSVNDILKLSENFRTNTSKKYGKNVRIFHSYENLSDYYKRLLDFSVSAVLYAGQFIKSKTINHFVPLLDDRLENFITIVLERNDTVIIDNEPYNIIFKDIKIPFALKKGDDNKYVFSLYSDRTDTTEYEYVNHGRKICFINQQNRELYFCSEKMTSLILPLYKSIIECNGSVTISQQDMPSFYSAVVKPLSNYLNISGEELFENFIPPEVRTNLYLDSPEPSVINGRLEFAYEGHCYCAFTDRKQATRDLRSEMSAENIVKKYFDINSQETHHPLSITGDDMIYRLFSEGIPELSSYMEIYASDRFNTIRIRPASKISVGIRPQSNLLEIDISSADYTSEELTDILASYRQGHKYHRLKDGSFTLIDENIADLDVFTKNLDIKDKSILRDKIKIPMYRMLYLDSLNPDNSSLKFKRNNEFRQSIQKYKDMLENADDIKVPEELSEIMREYQKYGFTWMKTLSSFGFGGILADDMGLGKTIQAIALMLDLKKSDRTNHRCLVVCPASLTLNWENEIHKFAPSLTCSVIIGTTSQRNELFNTSVDSDIIITSYTTLTRDILLYENIIFGIEFIDEAQFIKNHSTQMSKAVKSIKSENRFALTGTPVENSLAELWSIFDFIMPDYLFNYTYFKRTYESPIVKKNDSVCIKSLQKIVSPFILRRMKKDVLTELPEKTITTLIAKMENDQEKLYLANVAELKKILSSSDLSDQSEKFRILAMLTRLRQICCDPSLVYENYESTSAKLEQCLELLESCIESGHKVLLFSQFTSMIDIISKRLKKSDISHYILEGKTNPRERIRMVDEFNKDSTSVFLISLKAGGTGLNLTAADIVIHYDPWWNASAENQATDRAYRIGQKNNVQVYKLITENSIEEKIQDLQASKSELAELALSGNTDFMRLSTEDILELIRSD